MIASEDNISDAMKTFRRNEFKAAREHLLLAQSTFNTFSPKFKEIDGTIEQIEDYLGIK